MSEVIWRLFHTETRQEIVGLTTQDVVNHLSRVAAEDLAFWFAWRDGWPAWGPVVSCPDLMGDKPIDKMTVPPPPPSLGTAKKKEKQEKKPPAPPKGEWTQRKFPRIDARLEVVVVYEKKMFRAWTKNVSLGGLLLEKEVPWEIQGKVCEVFISDLSGKEKIRFMAKILSGTKDPFRIAFSEDTEKFKAKLEQWLREAFQAKKKSDAA